MIQTWNKFTTTTIQGYGNGVEASIIDADTHDILDKNYLSFDTIYWMLDAYGGIQFGSTNHPIWWVDKEDIEKFFSELNMLSDWKAYLKLKEFNLA